jgi:DNA-binding response OmpR family regulator
MAEPYILVVDDQPSMGELLVAILACGGFAGRYCSTGQEALRLLLHTVSDDRHPVLLILLDLEMAPMDGETFLLRLWEQWKPEGGIPPPVIVVSAKVNLPEPEQLGVQGVLAKPFHMHGVLGTVRAVLGGSPHSSTLSSDRPGGGPSQS